jgi:hypothetical protein
MFSPDIGGKYPHLLGKILLKENVPLSFSSVYIVDYTTTIVQSVCFVEKEEIRIIMNIYITVGTVDAVHTTYHKYHRGVGGGGRYGIECLPNSVGSYFTQNLSSSMLQAHVNAVCPYACCVSKLHVHAECPCGMSLLHVFTACLYCMSLLY